MSNFFIYSNNKERLGILQNEESVQWMENYQSPGEVKVVARTTEDNLKLLVEGNRINNTDSDSVARITQVDIVDSRDEKTIIARGTMTSEMLSQRVVMGTERVTNFERGMYAIYANNRLALPIEIGSSKGYPESTETEITWNSVLDAEIELAEASGLGFSVKFNPETGEETFVVYRGIDRSNDDSQDYVGYFGADVGNLYNSQIISGSSNFKNVAIVAGEGEGVHRKIKIVSLGNYQGEERRELYVDRRDLQKKYQIATQTGWDSSGNPTFSYQEGVYTDAEYSDILENAGLEALKKNTRDFSISCDIIQENMVYGTDYFLGDRMPVKIPWSNIMASAMISSVNMIYELTGKTVNITLSNFEIR